MNPRPTLWMCFFCLGLHAAPDEAATWLARARGAIGRPVDEPGRHLVLAMTEQLHPDVALSARVEVFIHESGYRELQTMGEYLVNVRNWDGRELRYGEGRRLRHPLRVDALAFHRERRLWGIVDLASLPPRCEVTLGTNTEIDGHPATALRLQWPGGPECEFLLDTQTALPLALRVESDSIYGGRATRERQEYRIQGWTDTAPRHPTRIVLRRQGQGPIVFDVERWTDFVPEAEEFFGAETLRQVVESFPPLPSDNSPSMIRRRQAYATRVEIFLKRVHDGRFTAVASLGDTASYRAAILRPATTILVAPERLGAHESGYYMPMDLDEKGIPRQDVIVIRHEPTDPNADEVGMFHEASHLLLRRHQTAAPIVAPDDEDLVAFQEEMLHTAASLRVFEGVAFRQPRDAAWRKEALRRWGHVVFRLRYGLAEHQLTPAELRQFETITGFRFDLAELRQCYVDAGLPEDVLPIELQPRFEEILSQLADSQKRLRRQLYDPDRQPGLPLPQPETGLPVTPGDDH